MPNTIHGVQISVGPPASIDTGKRFPWAIVATIQHNQDTTVWYTGELVVKNVSSGQKVQLGEATARGDSENYYDLQNRRNDLGYLIFNPAAIPDYMVGQCELIVKVYRVNMTGKRRHQDVVSSQFAVTTAGVSAQPAILGKLGPYRLRPPGISVLTVKIAVDQRDILDHLISRGYLSRWT